MECSFDSLEFIDLIDNSSIEEIYLNSCDSKYILENSQNRALKRIGYNQTVYDNLARKLGILFFIFLIRYGFSFDEAISKSKDYMEQEGTMIPYLD